MIERLASLLANFSGQNLYLKISPDILDFTSKEVTPELHFFFSDGKDINLVINETNLPQVLSLLKISVFSKNMKILVWDWKNLASFALGKTKKSYLVDGAIIDLKVIESYAGKKFKPPKNFNEAMNRLKDLMTTGIWKEIEPVYKRLHLPLLTRTIPHLETTGLVCTQADGLVYANYEIDGQENGRLRCSGAFQRGFVPHAMTPELRESLLPREHNELFMLFDFRGQEVFMLAWMSQDKELLELCAAHDIYLALYEKITGKKAEKSDVARNLAKKIFLPVIYGQSAYMLSQRCGFSQPVAEEIIQRIDTLFPAVSTFIESYQKQLQEHGYAKDIFGKRRSFEEGKEYSVRNFAVQSPSAVVCLEKLNHLYFALREKTDLAYTVHDGYAVYATKENWQTIFKIGVDVLSGESEFCPGLKLKVSVKAGRNLNNLKSIARKGEI